MSSDTIVAARVPEEIKEQGNAVLAKLGVTPTQLINSAYHYVLEHQKLPFESTLPKPGKRKLSADRMQQIAHEFSQLQVCNYDYSAGGTKAFKEVLAEKIASDYRKQV